jgi:AcrR family transcriptional regulator
MTQMLGEHGYAAVTIGELARRAGVSRAAFYEQFADKEACLLAAYDRFAATLAQNMTGDLDDETPWAQFIDRVLHGYLGTLESDPVAARAFIVEIDAAGPAARARRREAIRGFAALIAQRHAAIRARDPALGPLPERVYLGLALGVRELVREALEGDPVVPATQLAADIVTWITAIVRGASVTGWRD